MLNIWWWYNFVIVLRIILKLILTTPDALNTSITATHYFSEGIYSGKVCYCHAGQCQNKYNHNTRFGLFAQNSVTNSTKQLEVLVAQTFPSFLLIQHESVFAGMRNQVVSPFS